MLSIRHQPHLEWKRNASFSLMRVMKSTLKPEDCPVDAEAEFSSLALFEWDD